MRNLHQKSWNFTHNFKNNTEKVVEIFIRHGLLCVLLPGESKTEFTIHEYDNEIFYSYKNSRIRKPVDGYKVFHECCPHLDPQTLMPKERRFW